MPDRLAARTVLKAAIVQAVAYLAPFKRTSMSLDEWLRGQGGAFKAALPATEDYDVVRADLVNRLNDAFLEFVSQSGSVTKFRNDARKALVEDIPAAFYRGYQDSAGEGAETEDDDESWLTDKLNEQLDFMGQAFEGLKAWRESGDFKESDVQDKADVWGATLDSIYAQGKLRGAANKMLTWRLGSAEKHCATCLKLDGQRHSAKWWVKHGYIPREPGSNMLECKGYQCDCWLEDDDGNEFTVNA